MKTPEMFLLVFAWYGGFAAVCVGAFFLHPAVGFITTGGALVLNAVLHYIGRDKK